MKKSWHYITIIDDCFYVDGQACDIKNLETWGSMQFWIGPTEYWPFFMRTWEIALLYKYGEHRPIWLRLHLWLRRWMHRFVNLARGALVVISVKIGM